MKKKECTANHGGHLCVLASQNKMEEIKALASHPRYICFNCGRVANCKESLCNPMPLNEKEM